MLFEKVKRATEENILPIFCVQNKDTQVPPGVFAVAYEPLFAIGTGVTDTPENASLVIATIKQKWNVNVALYGGSVTAKNVKAFLSANAIDGVLVGGASLDPHSFEEMVLHATSD
jgi:triosephosphate isomerase (TIM)